ncbi:trimethylamine methyltransferase family protein, partial [Nocardioides sp.]|uniref:trimethylamine methyltransferase family protein n=1 Tax=Nocardioides sp. TaxID=35761 RepID=UPI00321C0565
ARNPERNVVIGGRNLVLAPVYGPPFVRDAAGGRRYATMDDFKKFVKLGYMSNWLHHSGGTVCEPTDVPVNKRHLDMLLARVETPLAKAGGEVMFAERRGSCALSPALYQRQGLGRCQFSQGRQRRGGGTDGVVEGPLHGMKSAVGFAGCQEGVGGCSYEGADRGRGNGDGALVAPDQC